MFVSCQRMIDCRPCSGMLWIDQDPKEEDESQSTTAPILIEVVSGYNLNRTGHSHVSPRCVIKLDGREVHSTRAINDDPDPIWTVKTKALCIVELDDPDIDNSEVSSTSGTATTSIGRKRYLQFDVFDGSRRMGHVVLEQSVVWEQATGDRLDYELIPDTPGLSEKARIALRFRPATENDLAFLGKLGANGDEEDRPGLASDINFRSVSYRKSFLRRRSKRGPRGEKLLRAAPYADPEHLAETEWMTREEMELEALQPSKKWVTAGYGDVGTVYLEIIGCDDLPKLDYNIGSDPFVGVLFEDNMLRTEVIWNELNPRWMPWTTRAVAFKVRHPSSILTVGVFDYDEAPLDNHDPIGRVMIELANFEENTSYLLHYKLAHDPREVDMGSRGTLIIRLRFHWRDKAEAMRKCRLERTPRFIINVDNSKSYHVLKYLARGSLDMEKASLTSVKMYAAELASSYESMCFVLDVMLGVFLWRGRWMVGNTGWSIWFPIHSLALFVGVAVAIEYPRHLIPILLYGWSWLLISVNWHLSRHPNPWKRVKPYKLVHFVTFAGRLLTPPGVHIKPGQGVEKGEHADKLDKVKTKRMATLLSAIATFGSKVYRIYQKTSMESIKIITETRNWSILASQLSSLHSALKSMCTYVRLLKSFVNWRTAGTDKMVTYCLLIATAWLLLPVSWLALWALRITAWAVLGPWMKLVDCIWMGKWYKNKQELLEAIDNGTEEQVIASLPDMDWYFQSDTLIRLGQKGREVAEDALKLKHMREVLFGHYSEQVPSYDNSRYPSIPTAESYANPAKYFAGIGDKELYHVPGQRLDGQMIPRVEGKHPSAPPLLKKID